MKKTAVNIMTLGDGKMETVDFESMLSVLNTRHPINQMVYNGTLKEHLVSVYLKMFKNQTIEGESFLTLDFVQCHFRNFTFKNCIIERTVLHECDMREVRFINCSFRDCFFQENDFSECQFNNVTYTDCKHFQSSYTECEIREVTLRRGTAETFLYRFCEFKNFKVIEVENVVESKYENTPPAFFKDKEPDTDTVEMLSRLGIAIEIEE